MRALADTEATSKPIVARVTEVDGRVDPIALLAAAPTGEPVFYLEHPDAGEAIVAVGSTAEIRGEGPARFEQAATAAEGLLGSLRIEGSNGRPTDLMPRLVGGFAFADTMEVALWRDFAPCRFLLPRTQWISSAGRWHRIDVVDTRATDAPRANKHVGLHMAAAASTQAVPTKRDESRAEWLSRASSVLEAIEGGRFDKVVVARRESHALASDVDVTRVLADLRASRPSCYTFCVASGTSIFLGSSPEKLVSVCDDAVEADALAGTIARGATPAEDRALAAALAASDKDLREHALVVEALRTTLAPHVSGLASARQPVVRAFPEGHHLHTRVSGERKDGASVLTLVGAVHPTPAVCGAPRSKAQALVKRLEADRGWYSGGIGWLDARGNGLFAVALRAGLLAAGGLTTWAGAGIVAGSNVALELDETALKMRALLSVVGERAA